MKQLHQQPSYSGARVASPGSSGVFAAVFCRGNSPAGDLAASIPLQIALPKVDKHAFIWFGAIAP